MKKLFMFCMVMSSFNAFSETFILPPKDTNIVGTMDLITAKGEDTLLDIARDYGIGYTEIVKANPSVDRWLPGEGTPVVIPSRYILPDTPRKGLVLNLPEMRIYYYPRVKKGQKPTVITYPVGIGRQNWQTPRGKTSIIQKVKNPTWIPPASIRAEHAAKGDPIPAVFPAGPDNPLGTRKMRLGIPGYLIHGTNKPYGVGMRVSHGCVRMRKEDVEALYDIVPMGETVRIINQPLKIGHFADSLYLEFHSPLEEDGLSFDDNYRNALNTANKKLNLHNLGISNDVIKAVVKEESGLPVEISF